MQKLQSEKASMGERIGALQRNLAGMENEKREVERVAVRNEKDKSALKKTLDKVHIFNLDWNGNTSYKVAQSLFCMYTHHYT